LIGFGSGEQDEPRLEALRAVRHARAGDRASRHSPVRFDIDGASLKSAAQDAQREGWWKRRRSHGRRMAAAVIPAAAVP